jgi:hypothetical protein
MAHGVLAKLVVVICLTLQVWVGCAPLGVRFCMPVVGERTCCCEPEVSEVCPCCRGVASDGDDHSARGQEGCCIGVPGLPGPIMAQSRTDRVEALQVVVMPLEVTPMLLPSEQVDAVGRWGGWRGQPDPGRARAAVGISTTRLII